MPFFRRYDQDPSASVGREATVGQWKRETEALILARRERLKVVIPPDPSFDEEGSLDYPDLIDEDEPKRKVFGSKHPCKKLALNDDLQLALYAGWAGGAWREYGGDVSEEE